MGKIYVHKKQDFIYQYRHLSVHSHTQNLHSSKILAFVYNQIAFINTKFDPCKVSTLNVILTIR